MERKTRRSDANVESMDEDVENVDNSTMIINKMATLYAEKIMSDIVLVVGNNEYPSHKLILCASSEVFQIMLHDSKWSESSEKRITLGETPSCAAVFEDFLKYLYTGKIHLDFATVVPIVSLADKYNVKDLLKLGLDYMERNISTACKKNQVSYQFKNATHDSVSLQSLFRWCHGTSSHWRQAIVGYLTSAQTLSRPISRWCRGPSIFPTWNPSCLRL